VDLGLRDRVVLITGAGGGTGPTVAKAFAAEGAIVALHARTPGAAEHPSRAEQAASEIVASGGRAVSVTAELGSSDEIAAMVARVEAEAGPVTVLVTATSAYRNDRFAEIDDAAWASVVDDLLGATFRTCRAVVPGMEAAGFGRIVNIAARSGLVGVARATHYAAAKAGIIGLTASLAKELGPKGLLVNAVAPTQILTVKDGQPSIPEERQADLAKSIPLRRIATPDDLAALVVWLGSAANTYVSGQTISLTGGAQS
jgi:NAD(P)-dependent dehydrogenase (short-subunit alcohol dehydrogenase family)